MADIFGYNRTAASDVFVADRSRLTIVGIEGTDLIQNWNITYQQNIQPIYEVGSSRLFWAKSNPIGNGSISRIVGRSFLRMSSELCDTGTTMIITNTSGACADQSGSVSISCTGAICTSIGFQAQAGSPTVSEGVSFQFTSLSA